MPDGDATAAKNGEDQQDIQQHDPGAADRIEAAHRVDRECRVQHIRVGAIADAPAVRPDQRDGHALERLRSFAMTGAAVAERLALVGELMGLRTGANRQTAAQDGLVADYAVAIEILQQIPQRQRIDPLAVGTGAGIEQWYADLLGA